MFEDIQRISKKIGRAIYDYKMIQDNDNILLGLSGGKDSFTLLYDLVNRKRSFPIKYSVTAIHIHSDFCTCNSEYLSKFCEDLKIPYSKKDVSILKRLKPNKKMNCFWCANQRRLELVDFAIKNGFNKIALGHHLDDIIETFFMNIIYKSETSTMLPILKYDKYPITIIRPLALVKESMIIEFVRKNNLEAFTCKCDYSQNSKRKEIKAIIQSLSKDDDYIKLNIFNSMKNINNRYLL